MPKLPQIKGDRLENALRKEGWYVDRTRGSHAIMRHENGTFYIAVDTMHQDSYPYPWKSDKTWNFEQHFNED